MLTTSPLDILPLTAAAALTLVTLLRPSMLPTLMALEIVALTLTILTVLCFTIQGNQFLMFIILAFSACDASIGLALLAALARAQGTDSLGTTLLFKC